MAERSDLLMTAAVIAPPTGDEAESGAPMPREDNDRLIVAITDLQSFCAKANERYGAGYLTYHMAWRLCVAGLVPSKRIGSRWLIAEEALGLLPLLVKRRPAPASDTAA
jgi:hypothetical protein